MFSSSLSHSSLVGQTLVGRSGRKYVRTREFKSDATKYQRSVYLAACGDQKFVLKRVSDQVYEKCQRLKASFAGSRRLRLHDDENGEERTLIYEYLTGNLLQFVRAYNTQFSNETAMQIMWEIGKAVKEMHDQNILHVDLKPDNILLNWEPQLSDDGPAPPKVTKVVLSDLDNSHEMRGWAIRPIQEFRHVRFGNIRWRAPEMQTGLGIGLFSDVFACALTYIYILTGQVVLGEEDYDELAKQAGMLPEELALGRTIEFFGPVTPNFLKHTGDEKWERALKQLQALVTESAGEVPAERFEHWKLEDFPRLNPSLKELLFKMLRFDPAERVDINQAMKHRAWGKGINTTQDPKLGLV